MTEPVCILEDDVVLTERFKGALEYVESYIDYSKPQVVLLSNHQNPNFDAKEFSLSRCNYDMFSESYVLTPLAAKAILHENYPLQTPCDWWQRWLSHGKIELYHAQPTVCTQDQTRFSSNLKTIDSYNVSALGRAQFVAHKVKRCLGVSVDFILSRFSA